MTMHIAVLGTDYEGLTISAGLATLGHSVTTVDTNHNRIRKLQRGLHTIEDKALSKLLRTQYREGLLKFTSEPETCLGEADVVIITGEIKERMAILKMAECLSGASASYSTVLVSSRTPVGSCRLLQDWLDEVLFTATVNVVSFPVFFDSPGGLEDFLHPGKIILGYEKEQPRRVMDELFANLLLHDASICHVSWEAAEMMRAVDGSISAALPEENPTVEVLSPENRVYSRIS